MEVAERNNFVPFLFYAALRIVCVCEKKLFLLIGENICGVFSGELPDTTVTCTNKKFVIKRSIKSINPLSAKPRKWSNTLKQFFGKLPTNCLSVFDGFVGLARKGLKPFQIKILCIKNLTYQS